MEISPLEKARRQAFRLLSLRARSEKEIRDRLTANHGGEITAEVIRQLQDEGFLNDEAFARERARQLAVSRLEGNRAIEADLFRKGIDRPMITGAIHAAREELSEPEAIRKLLAKRGQPPAPPDRSWTQKTGRYLLSKGFSAGLIFEVLNE
ncbi:MAG: RecX family transcriptional regulator [Syntrophales bacterium]|nr:RecX family transcriptional regulator [Syntrophales bacterium]